MHEKVQVQDEKYGLKCIQNVSQALYNATCGYDKKNVNKDLYEWQISFLTFIRPNDRTNTNFIEL